MQTLITVGIIVLLFALIAALLIPVVKKMTRDAQWEYELRRDGVTVQGQIIYRHDYRGKNAHSYYLKYKYVYDGVSYERQRARDSISDLRACLTALATKAAFR